MVELKLDHRFDWVAKQCEKYIGPRKFWIHNRIGGDGWDVRIGDGYTSKSVLRLDDDTKATFLLLKL